MTTKVVLALLVLAPGLVTHGDCPLPIQVIYINTDSKYSTGMPYAQFRGFDVVRLTDGTVRAWPSMGILPAIARTTTNHTDPLALPARVHQYICPNSLGLPYDDVPRDDFPAGQGECPSVACYSVWVPIGWMALYSCEGDPYEAWPTIVEDSGLGKMDLRYFAEWMNCFSRQE